MAWRHSEVPPQPVYLIKFQAFANLAPTPKLKFARMPVCRSSGKRRTRASPRPVRLGPICAAPVTEGHAAGPLFCPPRLCDVQASWRLAPRCGHFAASRLAKHHFSCADCRPPPAVAISSVRGAGCSGFSSCANCSVLRVIETRIAPDDAPRCPGGRAIGRSMLSVYKESRFITPPPS